MRKTLAIILSFFAASACAQTYTQMQWGMDKTVTPYNFGANIGGTWRNLGTVSSAGAWAIPTTNISGLGPAATLPIGTTAGTIAAGNDSRIVGALQKASDLSDIANATNARTNLGLGTAATLNSGTSGAAIPLLNGVNTWSGAQTFNAGATIPFTSSGAGAVARTVDAKLKDYWVTPQDFNATAGSGNDDAAAIQAAVNAVITAGGGTVYFPTPSSGNYNICSSDIDITTTGTTKEVHFVGNGEGRTTIRIKPGCASPPQQLIYILNGFADTSNPISNKSAARVSIEHLRLDGYCLSKYNVLVAYAVGLQIHDSILRNVASGTGNANYKQTNGYETNIDFSNRLENMNEQGHTCYTNNAAPDYNLWAASTDSHYGMVAVNAKIANIYQERGGNNDFSHSHAWGYPEGNVIDGQTYELRPQYSYKIHGSATIVGAVADSFQTGGFYINGTLSNATNDTSGGQLIGSRCMGIVSAGTSCIIVDNTDNPVQNWYIAGNNTQGITTAGKPIKIIGSLNSSTIIKDNPWYSNATNAYFGGAIIGSQTLAFVNSASQSSISASASSGVASDPSYMYFTANGTAGKIVSSINDTDILTQYATYAEFGAPAKLKSYTISGLPTCNSTLQGSIAVVSNGTDYATGTYGSAVSATGSVTRNVLCTNTAGATTYAWAYN